MVFNNSSGAGVSEWVAFESHNKSSEGGFEAIVRPNQKAKNSKRAESARRHNGNSSASSASWMNKPINSDSSWAPVAPPSKAATEPPTANKRRPPRVRTSSTNMEREGSRRQNLNGPNPVSSSDSSADGDRSSRARSVERTASSNNLPPSTRTASSNNLPRSTSKSAKDSRRGRSRTRTSSEVESVSANSRGVSRGRSSSRTRSSAGTRDRSSSVTRNRSSTKSGSRSGSRPPPTSASRRSRSTSRTPVTRARSTSRSRTAPTSRPVARPPPARPPPSTSRTRREMRAPIPTTSSSVGPGLPRRSSSSNRSVASAEGDASFRTMDDNIGRDISFGRTKASRALTPTGASGKQRSGFMEKLFGDQVSEEARQSYMPRNEPSPTASVSESMVSWQQPEQIHSRILLTATVYHNTATNLWIATINTNQKGVAKNPATASKYLKAFSFSSEKEARESAIANAPPKMMPFTDSPNCFICNGKFAMFRRAGHCRNCGVCICNSCSTMWPAKMIPDTYNLKKESQVKICKSCNFLCGTFKKALLDGDYEEAIALYGSGNINLRTPFPQSSKKKEEIMYPIHRGVEGGNIEIVRWLMEEHFCPIKVIRTGSGKKPKRGGSADQPILTSKNRSVLSIAMTGLHVDILRYLVVDNNVSIYESKDLKGSLRALEAVLLALPGSKGEQRGDNAVHRWDDGSFDGDSVESSLGADGTLGDDTLGSKDTRRRSADSCIICYDSGIDCVMTPCGHQVCCLVCSKNLVACPVCNIRGEFIKIFRP